MRSILFPDIELCENSEGKALANSYWQVIDMKVSIDAQMVLPERRLYRYRMPLE